MDHSNKVCPGTGPGKAQTSHGKPGKMPKQSSGASAGSNHSIPDNGCWLPDGQGTGKKRHPSQ